MSNDTEQAVSRLREMAGWLEDDKDGGTVLARSVAVEHAADLRLILTALAHSEARERGLREALKPFADAYGAFTGFSDGIDVRLDGSFALQDAYGRSRGATCTHKPASITVGELRKARAALTNKTKE